MDAAKKIAETVLYEGYILWPYRRSAMKNRQRWTFGGVYPRAYSEAGSEDDPWLMQTQCLLVGDEESTVEVKVRFLHVVERRVGSLRSAPGEAASRPGSREWGVGEERTDAGRLEFVEELRVGGELYLPWDEAAEREVAVGRFRLSELKSPRRVEIDVAEGSSEEPLAEPSREVVGALVRGWRSLSGAVEVEAELVREGTFRVTVGITNSTPWGGEDRESTLRQTFVSTHTTLWVEDGEFVSLMDPPEGLEKVAEECENVKTWPVLVGEEGERGMMLSSPIILYDYPQIAPESPGDLFDGGEIDQLLILNTLTLTDEEKEEMRATDPRAREILERSEALSEEDFMNLHGAIRGFQMLRGGEQIDPFEVEGLERSAPQSVVVNGVEIEHGSRVKLWPQAGKDIMDLVLTGKVAIVEKIEQDFEDRIHISVTIEDDPGRELGGEGILGHRFFFSPEEVEPLDSGVSGS